MADAWGASETLSGRRHRSTEGALGSADGLPVTRQQRHRVSEPHSAFVVHKEVVGGHAQWWEPEAKARCDATHASPAGGVDAATSAWAAGERSRVPGQELTGAEEKRQGVWRAPPWNGNLVLGGISRYVNQRERATFPKFIVNTRWVLTRGVVGGGALGSGIGGWLS